MGCVMSHILSETFDDLLCFYFMCCAEKVRNLINRPVVCLFGTRVGGTRVKVITYGVSLKFPATTSRERILRNHWDLDTHGGGKECLSKTNRPGFVSTVRPDLPHPTHALKEEDTLGDILFLRLKDSHLRPQNRVLNGSHYVLLLSTHLEYPGFVCLL
jgi:hypothetical protein